MSTSPLFRPEALRQLAAVGEGDRLPGLVGLRRWLALAAAGGLCAAAVGWGVGGRVAENVEGAGMFLHPGKVRPLQTPAAGQVVQVCVRANETVARGQVVVALGQPQLRQEYEQAAARLAELRRHDGLQRELERGRLSQEESLAAARKTALGGTIAELKVLSGESKARQEELAQQQRQRIESMCETVRGLIAALARQQANVAALAERKLATQEQLSQAESAVTSASLQLAGLEKQRAEIDLQDFAARKERVEREVRIAELELEVRQVDLQLAQSRQDVQRQQAERALQLQLEDDKVQALEAQLAQCEQVRSHEAGRVLEISVQPGQVVAAGMRVALLAADDGPADSTAQEPLRVVAYLPLAGAKRVGEGMPALVTPTAIERQRYGSIVGTVRRVAAFPTTQEAAAAAVGSADVVRSLAARGGVLEVEVELQRADTPSGFRWTSAAPPQKFTAGTTARVQVTVDERAPASFLLPWFRQLFRGPEEELPESKHE